MLSLVFAAKCSHKLGELPAGVRGTNIAGFYLFQSCFSQLFGGQKVTKSPGTREKQSAGSLLTICRQDSSVEPALTLKLFFCFTALRNLCGKALLRKYNALHGKQSSLSPVKQKSSSCVFQRCHFAFGDGLPMLVQTKTVPPF